MAYYESHHRAGRHFLQIPGPTNVPERVLRAIDNPTMDQRAPDFGRMAKDILANIRQIFQTGCPVVIFPASGTGAWEAAAYQRALVRRHRTAVPHLERES